MAHERPPNEADRAPAGIGAPALGEPGTLPPVDMAMVEARVRETGAFSVVQWLLDTGVLPYSAYEHWRYGALADLESALACDPDALSDHLAAVEGHAHALGLVNAAETFYHWSPEACERVLRLSPREALSERLAQRWQRAPADQQLDLFMDTGAIAAEHDLAHSLAAHNRSAADEAYRRLCHLAPNHAGLGPYDNLVLYSAHISERPGIAADEIADELDGLDSEIAPMARDWLGPRAGDYLAPAWRRLAHALRDQPFDPDRPRLHASYPWARIPEPAAVRAAIEAESAPGDHPMLLLRWSAALEQQRRGGDALIAWARCYELAPDTARSGVHEPWAARLREWLYAFDDLGAPLTAAEFPAWLLLQAPALAERLDSQCPVPAPASAPFHAARSLVAASGDARAELAARERLQQVAPALLDLYLRPN